MTSGRVALVGGFAIIAVLAWVAVTRFVLPASVDDGAVPTGSSASTNPSSGAVASEAPGRSASPVPITSSRPSSTPTATPTATPKPTKRPTTTGDPRVAYAAFLARLDDARRTATDLADGLAAAVQAGDRATARATAVDILQFADGEHDWLKAHPPADCYAAAHDAAGSMVEAYATVADRAIDWVDAPAGLAALDALGKVLAAGADARDAASSLAGALEASTCLR